MLATLKNDERKNLERQTETYRRNCSKSHRENFPGRKGRQQRIRNDMLSGNLRVATTRPCMAGRTFVENHALINDACEARSVSGEGIIRKEIYNAVSGM